MPPRRSRKRSGTSSRPGLPKLPPLYIDESLSQIYLPTELRSAGLEVIVRADRFKAGVTDQEWLAEAGRRGWIVLTKDQAIRHRSNELGALVNSRVRAFVLAAGEMTGPNQAALFRRVVPRIRQFVAELLPPFIVRLSADGSRRSASRSPRRMVTRCRPS